MGQLPTAEGVGGGEAERWEQRSFLAQRVRVLD